MQILARDTAASNQFRHAQPLSERSNLYHLELDRPARPFVFSFTRSSVLLNFQIIISFTTPYSAGQHIYGLPQQMQSHPEAVARLLLFPLRRSLDHFVHIDLAMLFFQKKKYAQDMPK